MAAILELTPPRVATGVVGVAPPPGEFMPITSPATNPVL
jgi:hypothetical protein